MRQITRQSLLEAGARNLREFGYTDVKAEDIMGSYLLRRFFERMLEECEIGGKRPIAAQQLLDEALELDKKEK